MVASKYWSPAGSRITVPYTGNHDRVVVYGAVSKDGRQFFRTYDRFNAKAFVRYLREMHWRFGKVAVMVDRASPHRARLVKKLLKDNRDIRIIYLPKGSPYLNAIEECWHQAKRVLLVSEYYLTLSDLWNRVSEYFRTVRYSLDIIQYANRKTPLALTNF